MTSATLVERAPRLWERTAAMGTAQGVALAAGLGATALVARGAIRSLTHLYWSPGQIGAALGSLSGLVAAHPLRAALSMGVGIGAMLLAELRPLGFRRAAVAAWLLAGWAASLVYLLSALGVGDPIVIEAVAALAACAFVVYAGRSAKRAAPRSAPVRPLGVASAVAIGAVAGLILLRAALEVITEWDAIVYHASFARDWSQTLPSLPQAAGPSLGAEMSYSYPALFPSLAVTLSRGFAVPIDDAIRIVSPLAFVTTLGLARTLVRRGQGGAGWLAAAFLLGSPMAVAYAEWPTAYALLALLAGLAAAELLLPVSGRRSDSLVVCGLLGLVAGTAVIGMVLAAVLAAVAVLVALWRRHGRTGAASRAARRLRGRPLVGACVLIAPLAAVCVGSLRRTGGVFFPWIVWPHAASLLPSGLWSAAQKEILTNGFAQTGSTIGQFLHPLVQLSLSALLFPGGLVVAAAAAVALTFALEPRGAASHALLVAALALVVVAFVGAQLVWPRYLVVVALPVAAVLASSADRASRAGAGRSRLLRWPVLAGLSVTAIVSALAGASLALAGPNDYTWTSLQDYAGQHVSAFDSPRAVTDVRGRLQTVFGDDARAWRDIGALDARGLEVGTFDVRNYYAPYHPALQMDGLAAAGIDGRTASAVVAQLRRRGIGAVFVPSWFWEPGATAHPLATTSPIVRWVGAPQLSAWRVYLPERSVSAPSVLYRVGSWGSRSEAAAAALADTPSFSVAVPLAARTSIVGSTVDFTGALGGSVGDYRMAAPVGEYGSQVYRLVLRAGARGSVTVFEPRQPTLFQPIAVPQCAGMPGPLKSAVVDFRFPGSPLGYAILDIGSSVLQDVSGRLEARLSQAAAGTVSVHACGDPTTSRGGAFPAGSLSSRIDAPTGGRGSVTLAFEYRDDAASPVSLNAFDARHRRWLYDVAFIGRCGGGGWRQATVRVPTFGQNSVELGLVVEKRALLMRDLHVVPGGSDAQAGPAVSSLGCGDATTSRGGTFLAGLSSGRIIVEHRGSARLRLGFDYLDKGRAPVFLNAFDSRRGRWLYDVARVSRHGSGRWVHATLPVPLAGRSSVQLGLVVTGSNFAVRNLRVSRAAPST